MSSGHDHPPTSLGSLVPGTHLCAFPRNATQMMRIAATFVGQGLAAGDQVLCVTTDGGSEELLGALPDDAGAGEALSSGQLTVSSFADAYGTRRPDDLGTVAEGFRAAAAQSRKDGFPGLRVAAQMDGLAPLLGSPEEVLRWEHMCTDLQREIGVSSVCLYDASTLDAAYRDLLAHEHAGLSPELAVSPLARFHAVQEPWGLRVRGEVDISNRDLFLRTLVSRARVTPQVHVDLGGLTFSDIGSLAQLRAVATELPESGFLVLHGVTEKVRRVLAIAGIHHERLRFGS